jgi:transposase-like protein
MEAMAKHRTHSVEFKHQVVQEYLGGETMHGLAKRHDLSRNLIRIWVQKYEAGGLDEDAAVWGVCWVTDRLLSTRATARTSCRASHIQALRARLSCR